MGKPGPKENLVEGQEYDINRMFYRDYMKDYFNIKITNLIDLLSNAKDSSQRLLKKNCKIGKIEFKTMEDSLDTIDKISSFAKSEIVSEYYHCLETFIRLFISHALFEKSPLMELTAMDVREYHKYLNQIVRGDFENLNNKFSGDETISLVLLGTDNYKESGLTKKQFNNLKRWIIFCAQQLQDMPEYNSFKHGLSMFVSKAEVKMSVPDNKELSIQKEGDIVYILESEDTGARYEFKIKNIFVEYDFKVTLMLFYNEMINNIMEIGECWYVTNEDGKTISGLHFTMFDYQELREMFLKNGNIGNFISSYSINLSYAPEDASKNHKKKKINS